MYKTHKNMWDFKYVFRERIQLTPVINGSIMTDVRVYKGILCKYVGKKDDRYSQSYFIWSR